LAPTGFANFWLCVSSKEQAQQALATLSFASSGAQGVGLPSRVRAMISEVKGAGLDGAVLTVLGKVSAAEAAELETLRSRFEDQRVKHDSRVRQFVEQESAKWQSRIEGMSG
jgi:hypothetical protein